MPESTSPHAPYVLADLPSRGARLWPERPALLWDGGDRQRTWAAFDDRVRRLTTVLAGGGVGAGTRVGVLASNRTEHFEVFFACARIGAVMVPLNTRLATREISHQVTHAEMAIVLVEPDLVDLLGDVSSATVLRLDDALDARIDAAMPMAGEPTRDDRGEIIQMYTSGTTGVPKGCLQSAYGWFQSCLGFSQALRLPEGAVLASGAPYFHSFGFGLALAHLLVGGTVAVISSLDGDDYWPTVDACDPHTVVPTRKMPMEFTPRESVRVMIGQASQYRPELGEFMRMLYPNAEYAGVYGLTEATNIVMVSAEEDERTQPGVLGRPLLGIDVRVAHPDGALVSPGETGEIQLRGEQLCVGYWRDDEATGELFDGGWMHTGDLATVDEDGWVYFADRSKDMIKTGGENVYSAEVERALRDSGLVADVAVFGVPDKRWTETVKAIVVLWEPDPGATDALDAHCRATIAGYKRPRWYEVVDTIPRNDTNKVLKSRLRDEHDPSRCTRPPTGGPDAR